MDVDGFLTPVGNIVWLVGFDVLERMLKFSSAAPVAMKNLKAHRVEHDHKNVRVESTQICLMEHETLGIWPGW